MLVVSISKAIYSVVNLYVMNDCQFQSSSEDITLALRMTGILENIDELIIAVFTTNREGEILNRQLDGHFIIIDTFSYAHRYLVNH